MASKPGGGGGTAVEGRRSSPASFVNASGFKFGDRDRKTVKLKLRKGLVKDLFGSPQKDSNKKGKDGDQDNDTASGPSSPVIPEIDAKTMALFPTGKPRETILDTVICKHCKKPVLRTSAVEHIKGCYKAKQEKQRKKKEARDAANKLKHGDKDKDKSRAKGNDDDDNEEGDIPSVNGSVKTSKKSAVDDLPGNKKGGKKRKADADDDKDNGSTANGPASGPMKKKKKKDEPKKPSKFKGPVDVERQCGVVLPNGGQCARSLTCKSHSMGAKRAVPGRSLPYDMLLQAYQKKNQARQQKAAIDANAPVVDEDNGSGKVNSDDEKDECMSAIERMWANRSSGSLAEYRPMDTRTKYRMVRVRDMFMQALGGSAPGGGGNGAGLFGPATIGPFGASNEGLFTNAASGLQFNIFGPDVYNHNAQASTPAGHTHGQPASSANVTSQPQSATTATAPALPSPTVSTAGTGSAAGRGNRAGSGSMSPGGSSPVSTGASGANGKRQSSISMSQQAQVNAATAAAANNPMKKVAAQG
ncbi:SCA7 domain protein [Ascosphaera apis ARSEF 7405]|uniref:SCA7 domain protein n=1 Tax=Ascosphaera apis ARSEF 7405 TaxID=392613 RepID=A0A166NZK6_9EURO|nr:SCA7 domain protein [Ascosphaera apis ARSEF 7405]